MKRLFILVLAATILAACGSQKPLTEAQYEQSVRRDMPFAVSEFRQVKPDVLRQLLLKIVCLLKSRWVLRQARPPRSKAWKLSS